MNYNLAFAHFAWVFTISYTYFVEVSCKRKTLGQTQPVTTRSACFIFDLRVRCVKKAGSRFNFRQPLERSCSGNTSISAVFSGSKTSINFFFTLEFSLISKVRSCLLKSHDSRILVAGVKKQP